MGDAKLAIECGVDGVDVVIGTSQLLREHSHGKTMAQIQESAIEVIKYIKRYDLYKTHCLSLPDIKTNNRIAKVSKSVSLPKTLSAPISSTSFPSTRLSTLLV